MFSFTPQKANYRRDYVKITEEMNLCIKKDDSNGLLKIVRYGCLNDLFFLLYFVLNIEPINNPWLIERIKEVENTNDRTVDLWAREHWKSTIITFGLTIQDILKNPEERIGIFSHTRDIAKGFHRRIMQALQTTKLLQAAFPDILYDKPESQADKWSEDGIIVKRRGVFNECTVESWGLIDHMPTGKHFSTRVYDDIITDKSVNTPDQTMKAEDSFRLSHNLGTRGGKVRVIGTIYDFGDIHTKLKSDETWHVRFHPAKDENGNPVFLTEEELELKRKDMGEWVWNCQLLLDPIEKSSMKFLREWFKTYKSKIPHGRRFIVVDPAGSKSKKSDYTVMWAISLDSLGNYYVLDGARDRLNLVQRWETLKNLVIKWNINRVGYEKYGMQSDTEYIREKQRDDGLFFQIVELSGVASKTNRIKKLQPLFQEGRLFFPEALWYDDTEGKRHNLTEEFVRDEYMAFPSPAHDDMLDSLARIRDENLNIIRPKKDDPVPYVKEFDPFRQEKQIKGWMSA